MRRCTQGCPQPHFPLHWVPVPGQVVFGVIVLCVLLLFVQHKALKRKTDD